jgi:hypothetical protein
MSQQCPKCKLFNPPEAERCDCGYDFKTGQVRGSYLLADAAAKPDGVRKYVERASPNNTIIGAIIIVIGVLITTANYLNGQRDTDGSRPFPRVAWAPIVIGSIWLVRGLDQRKKIKQIEEVYRK